MVQHPGYTEILAFQRVHMHLRHSVEDKHVTSDRIARWSSRPRAATLWLPISSTDYSQSATGWHYWCRLWVWLRKSVNITNLIVVHISLHVFVGEQIIFRATRHATCHHQAYSPLQEDDCFRIWSLPGMTGAGAGGSAIGSSGYA